MSAPPFMSDAIPIQLSNSSATLTCADDGEGEGQHVTGNGLNGGRVNTLYAMVLYSNILIGMAKSKGFCAVGSACASHAQGRRYASGNLHSFLVLSMRKKRFYY